MRTPRLLAASLVLASLGSSGCQSSPPPPPAPVIADVPVTRAPYESFHIEWKHRLDQGYVFLEHRGDYRGIGGVIRQLLDQVDDQRLETTGPVFALYYDDPGQVPMDELRSRACLPVEGALDVRAPLAYGVLAGRPVIYCVFEGAYEDLPRAYPALRAYLGERGWVEDGAWRETYLNAGAEQASLLTEIQVPWTVTD